MVNGAQNVEVSKKFPCEKPLMTQLEIMERYTQAHRQAAGKPKERREVECLKVLYPTLFRKIEDQDRIAGRIDFLPIGFGCVTSLGGVGHYCVFNKLREFQDKLEDEQAKKRVDALYDYWLDHDVKTLYCKDVLTEDTIGRFIDVNYPMIATARLSGMMLDYQKLLDLGIGGLRAEITARMKGQPENEFHRASLDCLDLFANCADYLHDMAKGQMAGASEKRKKELESMCAGLRKVREDKPETLH